MSDESAKREEVLAGFDRRFQNGERSPYDCHLHGADAVINHSTRTKSTSFLPPETIEHLRRIAEKNQELFSGIKPDLVKMGMLESMPNISRISFPGLNNFPALSSTWTPFQNIVAAVQPKMFESAQAMARIYESISKPIFAEF